MYSINIYKKIIDIYAAHKIFLLFINTAYFVQSIFSPTECKKN